MSDTVLIYRIRNLKSYDIIVSCPYSSQKDPT